MQRIDVTGSIARDDRPISLAIGKFDGVHIGHQAILSAAKAEPSNAELAVFTFSPHPNLVLGGQDEYTRLLTPEVEKVRLLQGAGVKRLYTVRFTKEYASTPAEEFVRSQLATQNLRRVVVGEDFRFGQGGEATAQDLERLLANHNVPTTIVSAVEENGVKVSSSQIRKHLSNGRVEAAEALLGRPYSVVGRVVHGSAMGRTIGFPTANLGELEDYVLPCAGVYAISAQVVEGEGTRHRNWFGVLNAGVRPTVDGQSFRLEAHLFGFEGDLYGKQLRISFLRRVRDELKFDGISALTAQIAKDVHFVKSMLGIEV